MKLVYTSKAWLSIDAAIDFLLLQDVPKNKITEILNQLFQRVETLKKFPFIGQKENISSTPSKEYRRLIFGYYRIIYFIDKDTVYVARIFDSRQDPEKLSG
jgi:plasmid stabilization system protein ParE